MLESFLKMVIESMFYIITLLSSMIISPLLKLFTGMFPDFSLWLSTVLDFWTSLLNGVNFAKEVFLNITGFPRVFFYGLIAIYWWKFLAMGIKRTYKFLLNMYYMLRGAHAIK